MLNAWLFLAAGFAVVHWAGIALDWKRYRPYTKLAVMLALLAWFTQVGGWRGPLVWFGLGLVFGFAGDTLLEYSQRFFVAGLAAFLLGHVSYIIGFLTTGFQLGETGLIFGLPFLAVSHLDLSPAAARNPAETRKLRALPARARLRGDPGGDGFLRRVNPGRPALADWIGF